MAEKAGSVERRAGRSPSRRAQRSDFTLSQLNRAVIRLPPHAQEPLDDRVDVETRASHLRFVSRNSVYPFKPKAESLRRSPVLGSAGFPATTACPRRRANTHGLHPRRLTLRELVRGVRRFSRPHALTVVLGWRDVWGKTLSPRTAGDKFYWLWRIVWAKGQDLGRKFENLPTDRLQPTESATPPRRPPSRPRTSAILPAVGASRARPEGTNGARGAVATCPATTCSWRWRSRARPVRISAPLRAFSKEEPLFAAVIATSSASFPSRF